MYNNNILLQMKRDGNFMLAKTYSRNDGGHGRFFIDAEKLEQWMDNDSIPEFWDKDCGNILRITYDRKKYAFILEFWWLSSGTSGKLTGTLQRMEVDAYTFNQAFVRDSWQKILVKSDNAAQAQLIWTESAQRTLRGIQKNKQKRRALCKAFAQGALNWPDSVITLCADFPEGSFFFKEKDGICGGLICHESTGKYGNPVYKYATHT